MKAHITFVLRAALVGWFAAAALFATPARAATVPMWYGQLTWTADGTNPRQVTFSLLAGFQRSAISSCVSGGKDVPCSGTDTHPERDDIIQLPPETWSIDFGDGTAIAQPLLQVLEADASRDFIRVGIAQAGATTLTHTYGGGVASATAVFQGLKRFNVAAAQTHRNNGGDSFVVPAGIVFSNVAPLPAADRATTIVDLIPVCHSGAVCQFALNGLSPTLAAGGFTATVVGHGAGFTEPQGLSYDPQTRLFSWDATAVTDLGYYSAQVVIGTPSTGQQTVDFPILLTGPAPVFSAGSQCGQAIALVVGRPRKLPFAATDPGGKSVKLTAKTLPNGATSTFSDNDSKSPQAVVAWTPVSADVGTKTITVSASNGSNATDCTVTVTVSACEANTDDCGATSGCGTPSCTAGVCQYTPSNDLCTTDKTGTVARCDPATGDEPYACAIHESDCSNCADDDGNGKIDSDDPDCCDVTGKTSAIAIHKGRVVKSQNLRRLRFRVKMADVFAKDPVGPAPLTAIHPVGIVLAKGATERCVQVDDAAWAMGKRCLEYEASAPAGADGALRIESAKLCRRRVPGGTVLELRGKATVGSSVQPKDLGTSNFRFGFTTDASAKACRVQP